MKWSFASVGVLILGLIGVSIILLFQQLTTNNENDYYLLKEVTEASMLDAIDYKTYRETGELKIREKVFVESFTRRFAESTLFVGSSYTIKMYDIMESPPKVTIIIDTGIGKVRVYNDVSNYSVANDLSSILEYNNASFKNISNFSIFYDDNSSDGTSNSKNEYFEKTYSDEYYSLIGINNDDKVNFQQVLKVPDILNVKGGLIKNINISNIDGPYIISPGDDKFYNNLLSALLKREINWIVNDDKTDYEDFDYYDLSKYYNGNNLDNINVSSKLCSNVDNNKCNGEDTYLIKWNSKINNSDNKDILFVKYKIIWKYEIYK